MTESTLVQLGLNRLDEVLSPLLETLDTAAELGFLTCTATGISVSLTAGQQKDFNVTDGADLFTPTPYLLAVDTNDSTNWGILHLIQYEKTTGDLDTTCIYATKTQASSSWSISCNSALPAALTTLVGTAQTASTSAAASAATIDSQMASLNAAIASIQSGPVASVAGRTGVVVLAQSDITGLVSTLSTLATISSVNTSLSGKQATSAKLDTLINLTWAANKLIYATSGSTLGTTDLSDFAKTLLDDNDAATALATLGLSTFVRSLMDDADASTFLSTLGVSSFAKTILDDVDAAAVRTTLGITAGLTASAFIQTLLDDADAATARTTLGASANVLGINSQAGSYTLQASDNGKIVRFTSASPVNCTVPNSLIVGFNCLIEQGGAGQVTIVAGASATVNGRNGLKTGGQHAQSSITVHTNAGSAAICTYSGDTTT